MNIGELEGREFEVDVDVMGDWVHVSYRAHAVKAADSRASLESVNPVDALIGTFCKVVSLWDLTEYKDGPPVPIDPARLESVPTELLTIILTAVNNDKMARQDEAAKRMYRRSYAGDESEEAGRARDEPYDGEDAEESRLRMMDGEGGQG